MYGRGSESKIPNPPRTAVLPSWNGSQANPPRGSKFLKVGLRAKICGFKTEVGSGPATEFEIPGSGQKPATAGPQGMGVVKDGSVHPRLSKCVGIVDIS